MECVAQCGDEGGDEGGSRALVFAAPHPDISSLLPASLSSFTAHMRQHGLGAALMHADLAMLKLVVQQSVRVQTSVVTVCTIIQGVGLLRQFQHERGQDPRENREEAEQYGQTELAARDAHERVHRRLVWA